ncbi:MAG TPA: hypothetical protein PK052_02635 [Anaerohalosphaeraceae bacterium]|nr:hypothetical protein [Phycisphaerae bacterium]HOK96321.1 hypothetical protein [Anaerohalosphaeraceae bacterium]HOL30853.1 hypothetical protein [Anaerohalosphaeraceae bacterium]HOM76575.1 hypothetical protein [Anaerohalosphaeraceae bacterium]HPC64973.1 hypothetical protein [Anaerohalosphaeraceae bacterium]
MTRAAKIAFISQFYIFGAGCLCPLLVIRSGTVPVMYLVGLFLVAAVLFGIIWSVAVFCLYGRTTDA